MDELEHSESIRTEVAGRSSQTDRNPVLIVAWCIGTLLALALVAGIVVVLVFVVPHAQNHDWGVENWAAAATIGFGAFSLLGIVGGIAGVLLTVEYLRANNRIQRTTEQTLDAALSANDLSRKALAANEGMLTANRDMVTEMRESRLAETRPDILMAFKVINSRIWLVIGNYGGGAALDVRFSFQPALQNAAGQTVSEEPKLRFGLPLLAPRDPAEEIYFDDYINYFDVDYLLGDRPQFFDVTVSFREMTQTHANVIRTARVSLAHLAQKPPADLLLPDLKKEIERARRWSRYAGLTDHDRQVVDETETFVVTHIVRDLDVKEVGDINYAIREHG